MNWFIGLADLRFSTTERICAGVVSFEDNPYLPPITIGFSVQVQDAIASTTSKYNGSPLAPASFVRSNTQILFAVFGRAAKKYFLENGRYRCTVTNPNFSPFLAR